MAFFESTAPFSITKGAVAYLLCTFPLAAIWHMHLFGDLYYNLGYFDDTPNLKLGFATIAIQGVILSALFPRANLTGSPLLRGIKYSLLMGSFFWTSHVLAFVAKQTVSQPVLFITLETGYLLLQFTLYGAFLGIIHRNRNSEKSLINRHN